MKSSTTVTMRFLAICVLVLVAASACGAAQNPKNIILIIGDGMGIGDITGARCAGPGADGKLVLDTMPVIGLVKTHPENKLVTDSAASGTALATGHKTENGRISVGSDGKSFLTIAELAIEMGKSAGVVTTDAITGATPAVFYSHIDQRGKQDDIAVQLVASKLSVAMGSGKQFFAPEVNGESGRKDGQDLLAKAKLDGFDVVLDAAAMESARANRLLGLFTFDSSGPALDAMTRKAVSILSTNQNGFFLMAESCLPDKGGHKNDVAVVMKGVADLDTALRSALDFAARNNDTLVLVTADHETGGLGVLDGKDQEFGFAPAWSAKGHTGNMVPVYAYGPGAEKFSGTLDNTHIPQIMAELWGKKLSE